MRKIIASALVCFLIGFGGVGTARADSTSSRTAPCWKDGSTYGITECFVASYKQSDNDLNGLYTRIIGVLAAEDRQRLQQAERLWVAYRDATCTAERHLWDGGTGANPAYIGCLDDETRHRLDYLQTTYRLRLQKLAH